jgi:hypothetical protein
LAISLGLAAIEVDVWLVDGTLLAGHEMQDLSPERTLDSLYLEPLRKLLSDNNSESDTTSKNGIFRSTPKQDLSLLIDMVCRHIRLFRSRLT